MRGSPTYPGRGGALRTAPWSATLVAALALGCGGATFHRYPLAEPLWQDADRRPFEPRPEKFYSPYIWDGVNHTFFRPVSEFWLLERRVEAPNVNALDEVPDSSWYTNRLSRRSLTPREVALGACADEADPVPKPWTVVGGKPDGANPGFQIRDAAGTRYLLKTDGDLQRERPSGSDVVGAAIYWAAGYHTPCNRIVRFTRDDLELDPEAEVERTNGTVETMNEEHIQNVLSKATALGDGVYRASVSQFIEGRPISPWRYEGVRVDDPNDVIPHEHRREVRGMYVLGAWTDHIDARQENTLAAWMSVGEGDLGYVRHYMIDFGDCFGILFTIDELPPRFGHSGYVDLEHLFVDFVTLGLIDRPWHHARYGRAGKELGYYDVFRFDADGWRPGYPNKAFTSRTERDAAWMTRIVARFSDAHVDALVARGKWSDPVVESELGRILKGRRDRLLERYLTRLSPLTWPEVRTAGGEPALCLQDTAVVSGIRTVDERRYTARAWVGDRMDGVQVAPPSTEPDGWVCAPLPPLGEASAAAPSYAVVDVVAGTPGRETTGPARVHLYALGGGDFRVVGLERPEGGGP